MQMPRRRRPSREPGCARCGNADDLETVGSARYCLPCRTCPHGRTWLDTWLPGCADCVRALHTLLTLDGPRLRDVEAYYADACRLGAELLTWTFEETEALGDRLWTTQQLWARGAIEGPPEPDMPAHFLNQAAARSR